MRTAKLDEIVRQKDPALKSTVEMLATGQVSAALDALQQQGRVQEIPDREERVRAIAKSYVESPENTLIVSPDNASRRELNVAVRQELKATGALAPEDHTFRVLVQRQDMTGAERSWASHYEIDDVVRYTRGSKAIGIEAAAYASVVAINPAANQLTVEKANGELATYDPRRLTGVSVYREIEREFSVGDRIQFTAPDKSLGVANRDLAAIEAIHPDGRLSARLDNNRQIEFNAERASSFRPRLRRHQPQLPGPHRRTRPRSRRYQRPPGPAQLPLRLRLHLPRQPPGHALHRRHGKTRPPARSRCLENLRPGNQSSPIRRARTWGRDLTVTTIYDGGIAMTKMTTIPENQNNIRAEIVERLKTARSAAARHTNSIMTAVYWEIGRRIVKSEQSGAARANYGDELIK